MAPLCLRSPFCGACKGSGADRKSRIASRGLGHKTIAALVARADKLPFAYNLTTVRPMSRPPQLGRPSRIPASPEAALLDRVANPHPDTDYLARFTAPEFTTLCPITGQPDFAHLVIDYVPAKWLVESKSLKLYFASFRNHGAFHEDCTVAIGKKLVDLLRPKWLRIGGYWYPRGGMPIDVFWQSGKLPAGVWVPDQGVAPYRGRG
jgi:7-cyano-7-deazaguanine reductase